MGLLSKGEPKKGLVPFESEINQHWFMQMVRWYGAYLENLKKTVLKWCVFQPAGLRGASLGSGLEHGSRAQAAPQGRDATSRRVGHMPVLQLSASVFALSARLPCVLACLCRAVGQARQHGIPC